MKREDTCRSTVGGPERHKREGGKRPCVFLAEDANSPKKNKKAKWMYYVCPRYRVQNAVNEKEKAQQDLLLDVW